MAGPVIAGGQLLKILALKAGSAIKTNKFLTGATAGSLAVPVVKDIIGNDSELEEAVEAQLADAMTTSDKEEVKKSLNFIASMFEDGVWLQPLADNQQHRYLIVDFVEDKAYLTVNRSRYTDIKKAILREREKWQYASTKKKR